MRTVLAIALVALLCSCRRAPPADYGHPCHLADVGAGVDAGDSFTRFVCGGGFSCVSTTSICDVLCPAEGCNSLQPQWAPQDATCSGVCHFRCSTDDDCPLGLLCNANVCGG